jgi:glycosyltransferase involved in cell wall biosynthesis
MISSSGGYSLIEMGLMGVPTIAYNYDIMSDLIYNRFNGYLMYKESPEELENILIEHFKKTPEELVEMKSNIKKIYNERFNLSVLSSEKEKIVNKIFGYNSDIKE